MLESLFSISPFLFAAGAAVGMAGWNLINRHILRYEKDYMAVAAVNENLSAAMILLAILVLGGGWLSVEQNTVAAPSAGWFGIPFIAWAAFAISLVLYCFSGIINYRIGQLVDASERTVVSQLQIVWVVALGALLLGEPVGPVKLAAAGCIIVGAIIATYKPGRHHWKSYGVRLAALVAIIWGTTGLSDKVAMGYFPPLLYSLPLYLAPGLIALALLNKNRVGRMKAAWKRYGLKFVLFSAVATVPFFFYIIALRGLPASVAVPLISINIVLTALGGVLFLGERDGWQQKIAGALLAFVGAWMIGGV